MVLHGDGSHKRRYLFAADAADAFDTILHKGEVGHVYNVGSYDEISNMKLCTLLLEAMNIPFHTQDEFDKWVKHTRDRPFNDQRYAVDDSKLRQLGWVPKTSIQKGLTTTLNWYSQFGEKWWGNISNILNPYPTIDRSCETP
jgi:dTDP-glucose 4,6-dehydratase